MSKLPRNIQLSIERFYLTNCVKGYIENDIRLCKLLCSKNKASLDIGANCGVFTLFLSRYSSHVTAIEPVPYLCSLLIDKFKGSNVSVENCALGNIDDQRLLNVPLVGSTKFDTRSSLVTDFEGQDILGRRVTAVDQLTVRVKRMDDFKFTNLGFIKIDVEGYEMEVLSGGLDTLKIQRPNLMVEIEQRHHSQGNILGIFSLLRELGYLGYFLFNGNLRMIDEFDFAKMQNQKLEKTSDYVNNFIFSVSPIRID